jgi:hypothetical protein
VAGRERGPARRGEPRYLRGIGVRDRLPRGNRCTRGSSDSCARGRRRDPRPPLATAASAALERSRRQDCGVLRISCTPDPSYLCHLCGCHRRCTRWVVCRPGVPPRARFHSSRRPAVGGDPGPAPDPASTACDRIASGGRRRPHRANGGRMNAHSVPWIWDRPCVTVRETAASLPARASPSRAGYRSQKDVVAEPDKRSRCRESLVSGVVAEVRSMVRGGSGRHAALHGLPKAWCAVSVSGLA